MEVRERKKRRNRGMKRERKNGGIMSEECRQGESESVKERKIS